MINTYTFKLLLVGLAFFITNNLAATVFYVSPSGSDDNSGSSHLNPFKTIQLAINQMTFGDELLLMDGTYIGAFTLKSGITITAMNPRKAVISGAKPVETIFEHYQNGIYRTPISGDVKQFFFDNKPMTWAQWPNMEWSENWDKTKKWVSATTGTGPGVLTSQAFDEISGLDLTGGYAFLRYGKGNSCYSRLIESFNGTTLNWNDDNFYDKIYTGEDGPRGSQEALLTLSENHVWHPNKSRFFLAGHLNLLDAPGEWFVENNYLYFYPPNGLDPNNTLALAKTIDYVVNEVNAVSNVAFNGIDFIASAVKLENSSNITFKNVHFKYIGAELLYIDRVQGEALDSPIAVEGQNIKFEKCLFAGAQNTALSLNGSQLIVENCVFMENNRHANFESRSINIFATGTYKVTRNTFFNNSSDAVYLRTKTNYTYSVKPEVSYNHVFNEGLYNSDVSGIYMPSKSQRYLNIHHNWIHNVKGTSVRLDLGGRELSVHHNVFWSAKRGMSIEGYGNFNIYNNTSIRNEVPNDLTRNILNHAGATDASLDDSFPQITDWNVKNNLVEYFNDRVGPREKSLYNSQRAAGLVVDARKDGDAIAVTDIGSIQGNITGKHRYIFINGALEGLNLVPKDPMILNGEIQTNALLEQEVCCLDRFRGAYNLNDSNPWTSGSDWMPTTLSNTLSVLNTMADSDEFATTNKEVSFIPIISDTSLPLNLDHDLLSNKISIAPNPVKDVLHIKSYKNITSINVYTVTGRKVYSKICDALEVSLTLTGLSSGIYILHINDINSHKIVVE